MNKLMDDAIRLHYNLGVSLDILSAELERMKNLPLDPIDDEDINKAVILVKKGDKGDRVNIIQSTCNAFVGKKTIKEDGDYGDNTARLVRDIYSTLNKKPQDFVDKAMYIEMLKKAFDKSPDKINESFNRDRLLAEAKLWASKHLKEGVGTQVWEQFQDEWNRYAGYARSNWAWCAVYVHELLDKAGLNLPYYYKGSTFALVGNWKKFAVDKGFWTSKPKAGDICIWDGYGHIGFVTSVQDGKVVTSEGNSNNMTNSRIKPISDFAGFISIPEGYSFGELNLA